MIHMPETHAFHADEREARLILKINKWEKDFQTQHFRLPV